MSDIETCIEAYGEDEANEVTMESALEELNWYKRKAARCSELETAIYKMSYIIIASTASTESKLQIQKIYNEVTK